MARKIGALWLRKTAEGKSYMTGVLEDLGGNIPIAVFKNDRKEKESQPDYQIILSEKREESVSKNVTGAEKEETINVDDIPF